MRRLLLIIVVGLALIAILSCLFLYEQRRVASETAAWHEAHEHELMKARELARKIAIMEYALPKLKQLANIKDKTPEQVLEWQRLMVEVIPCLSPEEVEELKKIISSNHDSAPQK